MRREGVEGDLDMVRSFAAQGRADAQFMASIKYATPTLEAIRVMRNERDAGGDRLRKSELFNEIQARYRQTLNYDPSPVAQILNRGASVYYLATSPAYYLQNIMQPYMLSLPVMAGRHSYADVASSLVKAGDEVKNIFGTTDRSIDLNKMPADVRAPIKALLDRGLIDIGISSEMGTWRVEGEGKLKAGWNSVDNAMRVAVQKVETFNRLSTAAAAYRLEFARTKDADAATEYAGRILQETHGNYTSFNAPRAFNTALGKVMLQFRKFQLIQLTLIAKLMKNSLTGKNKAEARKALAFTLGHTAVMAGAMGLPGYAAISFLLSKLFGDEDEPFNLEKELRGAIGDEDIANLLLRGAPTLAGMDISGKVGMGNALSILPFSDANILERKGAAEALGTLVGGPVGSLFFRAADGLGLIANGNYYKGVEMLLPKGVSDAMKAARIQSEGVTRRNGDVVMSEEEINFFETALQAVGIQPVDQAVRAAKQNVTKEYDDKFQARAKALKNQYTQAVKSGDTDKASEIREAWKKLQAARREAGYDVQPLSDLLKAPSAQRERERNSTGGVEYNKGNKRFVEGLV
jgi:hypothetical protein